jgi:hypothetical protein
MKKICITILAIVTISLTTFAQRDSKIGGGYFGNTLTYPGFVFEYEIEQMHSEKASLPARFDIGFYIHPRYNTGIFANVNYGFRRYFSSGIFIEESIGIGVLSTFLNADAVYKVEENGDVRESSKYVTTDFMPSITLGIGYNFSKDAERKKLVWIRPQLFWQYPHKTSSMFTPALQVGYTFSL